MFVPESYDDFNDGFSTSVEPVTPEIMSKEIMNQLRVYVDPKHIYIPTPISEIGTYLVPIRVSENSVHELYVEVKTKEMLKWIEKTKKRLAILANPVEFIKEEQRQLEKSKQRKERAKLDHFEEKKGKVFVSEEKNKNVEKTKKVEEKQKRKEDRKEDHEKRKEKKSQK